MKFLATPLTETRQVKSMYDDFSSMAIPPPGARPEVV